MLDEEVWGAVSVAVLPKFQEDGGLRAVGITVHHKVLRGWRTSCSQRSSSSQGSKRMEDFVQSAFQVIQSFKRMEDFMQSAFRFIPKFRKDHRICVNRIFLVVICFGPISIMSNLSLTFMYACVHVSVYISGKPIFVNLWESP